MRLVLASTSPYRRELLSRLGLPFDVARPVADETPLPAEPADALARRLAEAKARSVSAGAPEAVVIGSDQVAECGGDIYGKPGDHAGAVRQLERLSGRRVVFHTALCVMRGGAGETRLVPFAVTFRPLDRDMIERYVERERPFDCAASAKAEGLGISLIRKMEGDDPTALIGLPLIALVDMLRVHGIEVP